jgi:hypothetical protein
MYPHTSILFLLAQGVPVRKVILMIIFLVIPAIYEFMASKAHLGNLITDMKYIEILARKAFRRVSVALYVMSFPLQPGILLITLSTTSYRSSLFNLS